MKRWLLPLLLFAFLTPTPSTQAIEVGEAAPDFTLGTLDGRTVHLSDFKGRVILLKLATTWCPTCKQQTQEFLASGDYLKQHDIVVVEVFLQDSEEMVREYLEGKDFPMQHVALLDDGSALKAYNVYLIPRTLLIDKNFVVKRDGSLIDSDTLIAELGNLVGPN